MTVVYSEADGRNRMLTPPNDDGFSELKEQIGGKRAFIQWSINYTFSRYNESSWKLKNERAVRILISFVGNASYGILKCIQLIHNMTRPTVYSIYIFWRATDFDVSHGLVSAIEQRHFSNRGDCC